MEPVKSNTLHNRAIWAPHPVEVAPIVDTSQEAEQYRDRFIASTVLHTSGDQGIALAQPLTMESFDHPLRHRSVSSISVAEFVIQTFIPDCVAHRRSSARSHFRTVLNHVLHPELVSELLTTVRGGTKKRLSTIPDWPYIDTLKLREVDAGVIQSLAHAALQRGYSTQMARQIRNVMSLMIAHAIRTGYYTGPNPANLIALPAKPKKENHILNLAQLASALRTMVYPEKHIAFFLILAELRVTEICGLQWKYVNVSPGPRLIDGEIIPPKTIAVRNQTYRGEFTEALGNRRRFVRIPDLLCFLLRDLKSGQRFTAPDNFVLASRNGNPVHPENIAARRLRSVGNSLGMPWLSWSAFVRTRNLMRSQSGRGLHDELQKMLTPLELSAMASE